MLPKRLSFLLVICYLLLAVFSYGFVDANFPLKTVPFLYNLVHFHHTATLLLYCIFVVWSFGIYAWVLWLVKQKRLQAGEIWKLIGITVGVLLFSFPALSYDIFNYLATAKVAFFYRENPYLVMPIEFGGEPMLKFMHAANKIALYGPAWILLTFIPHFLGRGNILLSIFTFKALVAISYLGLCWLIWKMTERNAYSLAFFALNPLVVIETLNSGHNDVVMMFWAFLGILLLFKKKRALAIVSLLASVEIKYATVVLLPLFIFYPRLKKEKFILFSWWAMLIVFLLSPLREEIYPWYFIWVISFAALMPEWKFYFGLTLAFSLGLLLRHTPWLYFRNWGGLTPLVKKLTTFAPPGVVATFFLLRKTKSVIARD